MSIYVDYTIAPSLKDRVEKVRAYSQAADAVCREHYMGADGMRFYEIGDWEEGTTRFIPLTPMWSSREAAWDDALERLNR